jgi:hypothetical protein
MDQLDKALSNLTIQSPNFESILYYELKVDKKDYDKIIELVMTTLDLKRDLNYKEFVVTNNTSKYKVNDEFHITVLYTGCKKDDRSEILNKYINNQYELKIEKIGINEQFICIGVNFSDDIPYYGNLVKHITFGLNKYTQFENKVLPKDSYLALSNDNDKNTVKILDKPVVINATFGVKKN